MFLGRKCGNILAFSDYNMEKVNFPENTLLYVNQVYLTVRKNKKIYYCDYYIIGQIVEVSNTLENISTYHLKEREVKMVRSKYNSETGEFLGLYEKIGFNRYVQWAPRGS